MVKLIFKAEVVYGESRVIWLGYDFLDDRRNISACAKGLFTSTGNNDDVGQLGIFPFLPRRERKKLSLFSFWKKSGW